MATEVYTPTTTTDQQNKRSCFTVPSQHLDKPRCCVKVVEVLLSFVAFVLEEVVNHCSSCGPLYFFEFVSCTAFLFTLLLLVLLTTTLHQRVGIDRWPHLDFGYTVFIMILFFIASIVFMTENGGSSVEKTSAVFGFLASVAFLVDVGLFVKTKGFLCLKTSEPTENSTASPVAEAEKLNANGNE